MRRAESRSSVHRAEAVPLPTFGGVLRLRRLRSRLDSKIGVFTVSIGPIVNLLIGLDGILFENFADAFIDWLGDYLGISLQISTGGSLQHLSYRAAKNNPVTFAIQ